MNIKLRLKKAVFYFVNSVDVEKDWKVFVIDDNSRRDIEVISRGIQDQRIETDGPGTSALKDAIDALEGNASGPSSGASGGQGGSGSGGSTGGHGGTSSGSGQGSTGTQGPPGPPGPPGPQGPRGEPGENGKSAFQLATENGFNGSLSEWLNSLSGGESNSSSAGGTGSTAGASNPSPNSSPIVSTLSKTGTMNKVDYHNGMVELHGVIRLTDLVGHRELSETQYITAKSNSYVKDKYISIADESTFINTNSSGRYGAYIIRDNSLDPPFRISTASSTSEPRTLISYAGIIDIPIRYEEVLSINLTASDNPFTYEEDFEEYVALANDMIPYIFSSDRKYDDFKGNIGSFAVFQSEEEAREKLPSILYGLKHGSGKDVDNIDGSKIAAAWSLPIRENKKNKLHIRASRFSYGVREEIFVHYSIVLKIPSEDITPAPSVGGTKPDIKFGKIVYSNSTNDASFNNITDESGTTVNIVLPLNPYNSTVVEDFEASFREALYS